MSHDDRPADLPLTGWRDADRCRGFYNTRRPVLGWWAGASDGSQGHCHLRTTRRWRSPVRFPLNLELRRMERSIGLVKRRHGRGSESQVRAAEAVASLSGCHSYYYVTRLLGFVAKHSHRPTVPPIALSPCTLLSHSAPHRFTGVWVAAERSTQTGVHLGPFGRGWCIFARHLPSLASSSLIALPIDSGAR